MAGAQSDVVGDGGGASRVQVDRSGRRTRRRLCSQRGGLELQVTFDVKVLAGVIFQRLVDDRGDLMLRQRDQLSGVRNGVARLVNRELMLDDGEAGFRDRCRLVESATLGAYVAVDVPILCVAAVETLFGPVLGVAELPHLRERLHLLAEHVRQFVGIHVPALGGDCPQLASHVLTFLSKRTRRSVRRRRLFPWGRYGERPFPARLTTGPAVAGQAVEPGEDLQSERVAEGWPRDGQCGRWKPRHAAALPARDRPVVLVLPAFPSTSESP